MDTLYSTPAAPSSQRPTGSLKQWVLASRPWAFTASIIPVALGSALAATEVPFRPGLFLLTLVAGILMQAAVNYLNTYGDYISGVDTPESVTPSSAQLVRGELDPLTMRNVGLGTLLTAILLGVYPVWVGGWPVLVCGAIGFFGVLFYTTFLPYKYKGLGPPFVFFLMGPLMVLPAWYIQGAEGFWTPLLASLPVGCMVAGILHGNDLRDIGYDNSAGISTPASGLGLSGSIILYKALYVGAYLILGALVLFKVLDYFALLPLLALPPVYKTLRGLNAQSERSRIQSLELTSGKLHFLFGLLLTLGVAISIFVR